MFVTLHILSAFLFSVASCQPFKYPKRNTLHWKGATVAHVHNKEKGYGSGVTKKLYPRLKQMGYNSVQLNTFIYQKSLANIHLEWQDPTLTNEALSREIALIHSYGMEVMLKPHIWVSAHYHSATLWRSGIDYADTKKRKLWFQEYTKFMAEQVEVAIQNGVEILVIGTELVKLSKYTENWYELIKNIRKQGYHGKLTYACEAWNAKNIKFWDRLDFIGLDFYYGFKDENPSLEQLSNFYFGKIIQHLKHAKQYNLEILFTELGFPSHEHAIQKPASWGKEKQKRRDDLQSKAYEAICLAMKQTTYPHGIWFWKYVTTLDSYEKGNYKTGFILLGKPAEEQIKQIR